MSAMSPEMSGKAVSAEEFQLMKQIMVRMDQFGVQPGDASQPSGDSFSGAMTDACKRHRDCDDELLSTSEYDGESWTLPTSMVPSSHDVPAGRLPVMPSPGQEKISLPAGVTCLEEWGNTLCELPAVAPLKKSYAELAADPDQHSCLLWIIQHESKKGPRVEDLAKYLKASKYAEKNVGGKTYQHFAKVQVKACKVWLYKRLVRFLFGELLLQGGSLLLATLKYREFESSTPPATLAFRLVNIRDTLRLRRSQKQSCGWFQVETVVAPGISNWYSGALVRFFRVAHRP